MFILTHQKAIHILYNYFIISVLSVFFQSLSRLYLEDNRRATLQAGFSVASDHRTSLVTWTQMRRVRVNSPAQRPTAHRESSLAAWWSSRAGWCLLEAPRRLREAREGRTREERVLEVMSGPAAPTTYLHAIPETGHRGVLQITHVALIYPSYCGLQTHRSWGCF